MPKRFQWQVAMRKAPCLVPDTTLHTIVYTGPQVGGDPTDGTYTNRTGTLPLFTLQLTYGGEFSILVRRLPAHLWLHVNGLDEGLLSGLMSILCQAHQARASHGFDFLWNHVQEHLPDDEPRAFDRIRQMLLRIFHSLSVHSTANTADTTDTAEVTTICTTNPATFLVEQQDIGRYPFVHWLETVPDALCFLADGEPERRHTCTVTRNYAFMEGDIGMVLCAGPLE